MYNKSVRCGNLIVSQEQLNPMVFWWGMKEVSRVGIHGRGNPEDSWRTNTLPMPTGLAPPKHHGVFSFGTDRVTHDTLQGLHGLPSQNTPHSYTPESKRRTALIRRLLKQLVHGGNKASCISELIRQAHLVLFGFSMLIGVNE